MAATPTVSVVMPVYNGEAYLREAIDTILGQTLRDFEFIIVNDGSTDRTAEILRTYSDHRIAILHNAENLGLPTSLNRGIRAARAPLVARADADDIYFPDRLAKQVKYMHENPSVGLASSSYYRTNEKGESLLLVQVLCEDAQLKFELLWCNPMCHPTSIYDRELVLRAGGYDEKFWTAQDYDLWARLRDRTAFGNLPQPLVKLRTHERSIMATRGPDGERLSLAVSQRLMARYLGREVKMGAVTGLRQLLRGSPVPRGQALSSALQLLGNLMAKAQAVESVATRRWARARLGDALMKRSVHLSGDDRSASRRLFWWSLRMHPGQALRRSTLKHAARLLTGTLPRSGSALG